MTASARALVAFSCLLGSLAVGSPGLALTRDDVMARARAYAEFDWECGPRNAGHEFNLLEPGKRYSGVSYNWGGFDSLEQFLGKVGGGAVAGNYKKRCGQDLCVRFDFAGLDCSGFISRCWGVPRYSTQALPAIAIKIPRKLLRPGDILNSKKKHVVLFDSLDEENQMWVYEASSFVRQKGAPPAGVAYRAVDLGDEYVPRRFYEFIDAGDRVRTERPVPARAKLKGGKTWTIPGNTAGTVVKGPEFRNKQSAAGAPADVWYWIRYDNGREGWSTLQGLVLFEEVAGGPAKAEQDAAQTGQVVASESR